MFYKLIQITTEGFKLILFILVQVSQKVCMHFNEKVQWGCWWDVGAANLYFAMEILLISRESLVTIDTQHLTKIYSLPSFSVI